MKNYLTPAFSVVKLCESDAVLSSTYTVGEDNFKGDTLTPDDMGGM